MSLQYVPFLSMSLGLISYFQVVWAGLPGQESGNSLVDVLYGDWNPSGRLPYTIAKKQEDYSAQITLGGGPLDVISIPYSEGLFIDYRHFDAVSASVPSRGCY